MRDDGGRRGRWSAASVTWTIIGINALLWVVFSSAVNSGLKTHGLRVFENGLAGFIWKHLVLHPEQVFGDLKLWQVFTSAWLHDWQGASHVAFNMLALFFFGRAAESHLGRGGYLKLYIGGALLCSLIYTGYAYLTGNFMPALGASGAVYAVLVWVACMNPRGTVYMMMIIPMPMWMAVGVFIVGMEVVTLAQNASDAGAAVGHLSGAAWGLLYFRFARRWKSERGPGGWLVRKRRERKPQREAKERATEPRVSGGEKARVDALLSKISREGMDALSQEEKDFLADASKRF